MSWLDFASRCRPCLHQTLIEAQWPAGRSARLATAETECGLRGLETHQCPRTGRLKRTRSAPGAVPVISRLELGAAHESPDDGSPRVGSWNGCPIKPQGSGRGAQMLERGRSHREYNGFGAQLRGTGRRRSLGPRSPLPNGTTGRLDRAVPRQEIQTQLAELVARGQAPAPEPDVDAVMVAPDNIFVTMP